MSSERAWSEAERWVPAAVAGDPAAVGELIRCTQADVWRFVASLGGRAEADDLTQETYLRALRALGGFEGRSGLRTWLLVIARRTVADHLRRQAVRPRRADVEDWVAAAEQAGARNRPAAGSAGHAVELMELLEQVPAERREALVLTQIIGLSYAEAAAVTDCAVGTIRSRVARGREEMAAAMAISQAHEGPSAAAR